MIQLYSGIRVARCPIWKVMPGCWEKWYLGKWDSPGANGHDSDIFNENYSDTATVFRNKLQKQHIVMTLSDLKDIPKTRGWEYNGFLSPAPI